VLFLWFRKSEEEGGTSDPVPQVWKSVRIQTATKTIREVADMIPNKLFWLAILVVLLVLPGFVSAAVPNSSFYLIPTDMKIYSLAPYDAMVYQDGEYTIAVARNGTILSSVLISAHTDDIPIQAALNSGSSVVISTEGTYTLSAGLTITESRKQIVSSSAPNAVILKKGGNFNMVSVSSTGDRISYFKFDGIEFDGAGYSGDLLSINHTTQSVKIHNCRFVDNTGHAIKMNDMWGWGISIDHVFVYHCGDSTHAGIKISGASNGININDLNLAPNGYTGLLIDSGSSNININGLEGESIIAASQPIVNISGTYASIDNSQFSTLGNGQAMIDVGSTGDFITISNSILNPSDRTGIGINSTGIRVTVSNTHVYNAIRGISVKDSQTVIQGNQLTDCVNGIYLSSQNSILAINQILRARGHAIRIVSGGFNQVNGNIIQNSGYGTTSPATYDGVSLESTGNNLVNGNTIYDWQATKSQRYGVSESGSSDYNFAKNNLFSGNNISATNKIGAHSNFTSNEDGG
jgi:hypothetical protein